MFRSDKYELDVNENFQNKYDVIVIGSGIGGLTCASILSKIGRRRVLVLERHFKPGGFTHTFRRNKELTYEWDVGLHYVGEMEPDSISRKVFNFITDGKLKWQAMPDVYDVFVYPDLIFRARKGKGNIIADLIKLFPDEEKAIRQYFNDLRKTSSWYTRFLMASLMPGVLKPVKYFLKKCKSRIPLTTTQAYLDSNFTDPNLKALLISQWGTYGLPPEISAFTIQALIANHYLNGGYYPVGGAQKIVDLIRPIIERTGGRIAVSHEVTEIIVKNDSAVGVKVLEDKKGETEEHDFYAPVIISATGAYTTYQRLLHGMFADELNSLGSGTAHVTLYAGLKNDPRGLGLYGENYWIFNSFDHTRMYLDRNRLANGEPTHCYVSFPSLKNPQAKSHTMTLIAFMDASVFSDWADRPWKKRGREYENLKQNIISAQNHVKKNLENILIKIKFVLVPVV